MTTENQGLNPPEVWTREYVRTELWANVYGDPLPLDADPDPDDIELARGEKLIGYLAGGCSTVLDVGCGWVWYEPPAGIELTGFDVSPPMLELARALHPARTFVQGSSFDLPFEDGEFEGVRSSGMLRHTEDWRSPLTEMVRVAEKRMAFTILTAEEPGECGPYQWCTTREAVLETLPSGALVDVETHMAKEARRFESTRFMVQL